MKNTDNFIPHAVQFTSGPVVTSSFTETRIPLYWGPGLSMISYPTYNPPDVSLWRENEPISIPETVRLMLGVKLSYDSDEYNDDGTVPPPPPVPGGCPGFIWEIQSPTYNMQIPLDSFNTAFKLIGATYAPYAIPTSGQSKETWIADEIQIRSPGGGVLFTGSVWDAAGGGLVTRRASRFVVWKVSCHDGMGGETITHLSTFLFSSGTTEADALQPPRCWFPNISGTLISEVHPAAKDWYGCGSAPGSPPITPPSPPYVPPPPGVPPPPSIFP